MIKKVEELRVKIDGLAQLTKDLEPCSHESLGLGLIEQLEYAFNSKEISSAVDSLYLAKAWLGKVLGELSKLGKDSLYSNDGTRTTVKDIEPAADVNSKVLRFIKQGVTLTVVDRTNEEWKQDHKFEISHIEKVDWLKKEIKNVWENLLDINIKYDKINIDLEIDNFYTHLTEARFWLGFELERIKKVKV